MNQTAILWPMFAHVLLVYIVYFVLSARRRGAIASGAAKTNQFKVRGNEPELSATASNNIINQFELPVLLYPLCLGLYLTNGVNYVTLALAWIFIVSRYFHAWVHLTSNRMIHRNRSFLLGVLVLGLAWIWFALHVAGLV